MQPPRTIPKVLVSLFGALSLLVASAATAGAEDATYATASLQNAGGDYDCDAAEWHFVINQLRDGIEAPSTISVSFEDGSTETVGVSKVNEQMAHYTTSANLDLKVTGASASIAEGWAGNFRLSHGPCEFTDVDDGEAPIVCEDHETPVYDGDDVVDCVDNSNDNDNDNDNGDGDDGQQGADKVTLCHATGSATNPYVIITVAKQAVLNGHGGDWHQNGNDIIPPFEGFDGLNTDKLHLIGQGCEVEDDTQPGDETIVEVAAVDAVCVDEAAVITFDLSGDLEDGKLTVVLSDDDDLFETVEVDFADGVASGSFAYPSEFEGTLMVSVDHDLATAGVVVPAAPDCELDGGTPEETFVGVAAIDAICVVDGYVVTIDFDLSGDVEDGKLTVVLSDDDDLFETVEVDFADGVASGSFAYPSEFEGTLMVSVDHDLATAGVVVPAAPVCEPGTIVQPTPPVVPVPPVETPPVPVDTPAAPVDIPAAPVDTPEPPTDVEGDEVVTPVTTFRPVVQPAGPVVMDQPTVMGDVTTRTVAGQLPRTGSDTATALAPFGLLLLLAGFALQRTGRRRSTIG